MSPAVLRTRNLRVVIFLKDHEPPHVHVFGPGQEAKFEIETLVCFYSRGFSSKALKQIEQFLRDKKKLLMEAWNDYKE